MVEQPEQVDNQLAGLMAGGGGDDFPDLTAQTQDLSVKTPEPEPQVSTEPISIPSASLDGALAEALISADFELAVENCLKNARYADALIIARLGGEELLAKTIDSYQARGHHKVQSTIIIR